MSLTGRLRRRTSSEKYIPGVDGLRFSAIVSVILLHVFNQNQPQTVPWGYAALNQHAAYLFFLRFVWHGMRGVNIFFAISGFILALPFARYHLHRARPVSLSYYFLRRLTRLEPPYLLVLLVRLPLLVLLEPHVGHYYLQHFAASCLYLHNAVFGTSSVINPPAWSLEIEIQFYCLVPLLAYYFAIRRPVLRRAAMLAAIACIGMLQVAYLPYQGRIGLSILVWLQYFLAGFFVADLYLTDWKRIPQHWLWDLTLPLWAWIFWSEWRWTHAAMPFAIILLFIAAFKAPLQGRFFANAWVSLIGGMCYSLYLTHSLVLTGLAQAVTHLHLRPPVAAVWILYPPVVLVCGTIFYLLVERPCMDPAWPRKLWHRVFPAAATTADPAV